MESLFEALGAIRLDGRFYGELCEKVALLCKALSPTKPRVQVQLGTHPVLGLPDSCQRVETVVIAEPSVHLCSA